MPDGSPEEQSLLTAALTNTGEEQSLFRRFRLLVPIHGSIIVLFAIAVLDGVRHAP